MAAIGLYHPYIQFKSDAWLKLAALYWDRMARIVPKSFALNDSDTVKALTDETQFVFNRAPEIQEIEDVALNFAKQLQARGTELRKRYGVALKNEWPQEQMTVLTNPDGDPHLGYIHSEKVVMLLREILKDAGLAEEGRTIPDVGLGMHPRLAAVYMLALARRIAHGTSYEPVTDETRNQVAMSSCGVDMLADALLEEISLSAPAEAETDAEDFLLNLSFNTVLPKGLEHIPVEKIIDIRHRWEPERRQFHEGLKKVVGEMGKSATVPDPVARQHHLNAAFETHVEHPLAELRKQLRSADIDFAMGAFSCSTALPAATVGGGLLVGADPWLAASGALAFGVYKLWKGRKIKREEMKKRSNVSYLVRLEQELNAADLSRSAGAILRRFRFCD